MKIRILFYLVCVLFGLACCGVVPSNFKSPHDEHTHAEDILASSGTNASIPTLENSESRNTSRSTLVDQNQLNTSEVLVSDFHDFSDLNHVQNTVSEKDLPVKKSPKGSGRSKDFTRFKKTPQGEIDQSGMNDRHEHHGSVDDHDSELHHLQTDHKTEDLKTQGSVNDHSSEPHLQTHLKTEDFKINISVDDHPSEPHNLQIDHKAEDLKIRASVDDHPLEPHHVQTDHKAEDVKIPGSVKDHSHSPEPHHPKLDHKSDNLGFHGTVEEHFPELDHASEKFSHTDKNVSKSVNVVNTTAHFDGEPGNSKVHSVTQTTTFGDMLNISDHELNNKENDFINQTIDNETHTEDIKHDANNLNQAFSDGSHSDSLINSVKDLTRDWKNISQEIENGSINNNLSEFPNTVEDTHDLNQDSLNDPVAALSSELINSVLDFTNDTDHANKEPGNDSTVVQSNDLKKFVNEFHKNVSEDLKSVPRNTSEFKNGSHDPPEITESTQEHFNPTDNTNNLVKSTISSITNSKLFLNIHNSFMRLNPTDKPNSDKLKHKGEKSESVKGVSNDLAPSKINEENSNTPSNMDVDSREVNILDIKEDITSPSSTVTDFSVTETEVKFSSGNTEKILEEPKHNKSELIDTVTEVVSAVENNASQGLFSSLGLDFLMNSELAKNAASAMEVFNFTDSALTDHIIDDQNDMHDFLDIRSSVVDDHNISHSEDSETINSNADTDSSTFNNSISIPVSDTSKLDTESSTLNMESSSVVYSDESDESSATEVKTNLKNETFVKKMDSLSELSGLNGNIEDITPTALNTTEELVNVKMVPTIPLNSTVEFEATTNTVQPDARNASDVEGEVKCPSPGICIFWFFAQDTCTINSHCLGSRICCRIGCSKTCVEV